MSATTLTTVPTTGRPAAARPASWAGQTAQVTWRWSVVALREPWGLGVAVIQPVIWLLLFGNVFSSVGTIPGFGSDDYLTFLVPGILMMTVLYSGAWAGTGFIQDIDNGVMDRLLSSPVHRSALVAGQLAQQLLLSLVQGVIVLGIGWLAGARYDQGVTVHHEGKPVPSEPHLAMTVETLRDAGAIVDDGTPNTWRVEPSEVNGLDVHVEPDLSNAAPFLAAALVTGGRVTVPGWPQHTTQAGDAVRDILDAMGADVTLSRDGLTVAGDGAPNGIDVDLRDASELTPVVAAVAALADSPSVIRGVGHIRGHETDRLAALARELGALGAVVSETGDGLRIEPRPLVGRRFRTYADHRMVMAAAVLGLRTPGLVVEDVGTVAKTLPDFTRLWQRMLVAGQAAASA